MNRSILIVICDFLVSSMLSMMTGMVPANSSGSGIGLDANSTRVLIVELERSRGELLQLRAALRENIERGNMTAENEAKLEELNRKLAQNEMEMERLQELAKSTPENTGNLSREELEKRLNQEKLRRIEAEVRDREKNASIRMVREMLKEAQGALQQTRESEAKLRYDVNRMSSSLSKVTQENEKKTAALAQSQAALTLSEKALANSRQDLAKTQTALEKSRLQSTRLETELDASKKNAAANRDAAEKSKTELIRTRTRLDQTQRELQDVQGQVKITIRRNSQTEEELNRLRGQNAATARELAEMKDKAGKLERELTQANVRRREAEIARNNMENLSKIAAVELAAKGASEKAAQTALAVTKKQLVESQAAEKAAKEQLQFLRQQTGTNLFDHYQNAVVKLGIEIHEKRVLSDLGRNFVHYLPVVKLGDKSYLIGALPMFAGGDGEPFHFQKVDKLAFHLSGGKAAASKITTPLLVSKREPYLGAFEIAQIAGVQPLRAVPADKLRQRGVQRLTLFKTTSCGKDSTPLGDRCSLDLQPGASALIIRNNARNANEIKAKIGDFVMTNDGDFVGVVVSLAEAGRYEEARVALCDASLWQDAEKIQISAEVTDQLYHQFGDYMRTHLKR
ncbi:MAG: hypothetical protein MJ033_02240 [Victivallaceae bacterium]|nr:hypothetical protein [Victivallaceae bacterium]